MAKKAKKTSRGRKQDRARVAGRQNYEVGYAAKKAGNPGRERSSRARNPSSLYSLGEYRIHLHTHPSSQCSQIQRVIHLKDDHRPKIPYVLRPGGSSVGAALSAQPAKANARWRTCLDTDC
jgi:hypothetical protein